MNKNITKLKRFGQRLAYPLARIVRVEPIRAILSSKF
jgi:hypothetical protein